MSVLRGSPMAYAGWRRRSLIAAVVLSVVGLAEPAERYKLVVHPEVSLTSITRAELSQLFMKKVTKWNDGVAVRPVDQPVDSALREAFSRDIHGKGASAVDAYWQRQIFTGRGVPPVSKTSDAEVLAYVRQNVGAIGYVSGGGDSAGVKVIAVQ